MIDIAFYLVGLADSEIEDDPPDGLRWTGDDVGLRLDVIAISLNKLLADGWSCNIVRNKLVCQHPEVETI